MEVKVEGGDDFANTSYTTICQDTFRDLGVRASIDRVYLYVDPKDHVFVISIKIGRVTSPVKVDDITRQETQERYRITNEKYAPKLLAMLWDKYGERVQQLSRLEISLKLDEKEIDALKTLIVYDPREDLVTRIFDGMDRILPEGARVRCPISLPDSLTIIASENSITEEWKDKAEEMMRIQEGVSEDV
jgi:putative methanogenesis marker protein 17